MAEITAAAVKQLRELTDLPMMACKQALIEAEGDQDKAVQILRESVGKVLLKRADNATTEGRIFIGISEDGLKGSMIELQCESAPVAGAESFVKFGEACLAQLMNGPGASTPEELLEQPAPGFNGQTLKQVWEEMVNKIREKIVVASVTILEGGPVGGYVHHDGKTGVLFLAEGDAAKVDVLRDVAMHIASMRPTVTNVDELDPASVAQERKRLSDEAKASGKPDNIVEKIVDGRMNAHYVEQGVLVVQPFVKEESKTVSQALAEKGLKAKQFVRKVLGV